MLPQRSGSHDTLNGKSKLVRPVEPFGFTSVPVPPPVPPTEIDGAVVTVGNSALRATPTAAFACRYRASACATFWFETLTCTSSALSAASLYSSHHRPFAYASPGWDVV